MSLMPGQAPDKQSMILRQAERLLEDRASWSIDQKHNLATVAADLLRLVPTEGFCLVGLSGPPGCGKSTLARLLSGLLSNLETEALVLSLDDYYLSRQERRQQAEIHPLFAQRGVPGTHDWKRLMSDLASIRSGRIEGLELPRFDKLADDRYPDDLWLPVLASPRVVFLEGWLIGAPPQDPGALEMPVNRMEASLDEDGRWRHVVNQNLAACHDDLAPLLTHRWFMKPPGWKQVEDWRWQQEREQSQRQGEAFLKDREAVVAFLDRFQRIATHMIDTCDQWADVIINIDHDHRLELPGDYRDWH